MRSELDKHSPFGDPTLVDFVLASDVGLDGARSRRSSRCSGSGKYREPSKTSDPNQIVYDS